MDHPPVLIHARVVPLQYATLARSITRHSNFNPLLWVLLIGAVALVFLVACIPSTTSHGNAKLAATQSDLSQLSAALSQFSTDTGRLPTTAEGLQPLLTPPDDLPNWHGPYILHPPKDPWGNLYLYRVLTRTSFDLRSAGPDGVGNTRDDIVAPPAHADP